MVSTGLRMQWYADCVHFGPTGLPPILKATLSENLKLVDFADFLGINRPFCRRGELFRRCFPVKFCSLAAIMSEYDGNHSG